MTTEKTAIKTARSPKTGAEIPLGAHPGNTGGKKGRSGRPRREWKDFLAQLRHDPKVQQAVRKAARDETSANFRAALAVMIQYDKDKPAEKHEHRHKHEMTAEEREARVLSLVQSARRRKVSA